MTCGDSRQFLRRIATRQSCKTPFVYLDAHWDADLPHHEELEIVVENWDRAAVMIDDFAVPDDPGYGYDDYGPGKAQTREYLPPMPGWPLFYPTAPSRAETGRNEAAACCCPRHWVSWTSQVFASRSGCEPPRRRGPVDPATLHDPSSVGLLRLPLDPRGGWHGCHTSPAGGDGLSGQDPPEAECRPSCVGAATGRRRAGSP